MTDPEDDPGILVEKGDSEKQKIKRRILKNQKERITSFFQEYRGYCKNSVTNRKDELTLLFNELEQTLTSGDKEFLMKQWKSNNRSVTPPIILVSTINQLQDIRYHLNSIDLARVSFAEQEQHHQSNVTATLNNSLDYMVIPPDFLADIENIGDASQSPGSLFATYFDEGYIQSQSSFALINRSDDDKQLPPGGSEESWPHDVISNGTDEIESSLNDTSIDSDVTATNSFLVKSHFHRLSRIIDSNLDILPALLHLKNTEGRAMYKATLNYHDEKEPLLFRMALKTDKYKGALDQVLNDGLLTLNLKFDLKTSIFSYLLVVNIESLFQFLKYAKNVGLKEEVEKVCSADSSFRTLLEQRKHETFGHSENARRKLESIGKFCIRT